MRVKFISPQKGFGIFSEERILKGEFIIEYAGEVISNSDVSERIRQARDDGKMNYILSVKYGNFGILEHCKNLKSPKLVHSVEETRQNLHT